MNDDIREKLSAYLDGALPEAERRAVELELSGSAEMRLELEALRAVAVAVKGLPKEKLPPGFMARLEDRRARDSKPKRDYFILPPSYRPLAFAMSTAVVALVVWDKTHAPVDLSAPRTAWDGDTAGVKIAAEAPPSIDVSGRLSSLDKGAQTPAGAAPENSAVGSSTFGKQLRAPGKPLGVLEEPAPAAPTTPASALDALAPDDETKPAFQARNEEERSAINERLYKGFEEEKKRMGIARIIGKDAGEQEPSTDGRGMLDLQAAPEAVSVGGASSIAKRMSASGSLSAARGAKTKNEVPAVKALALKSAEALQAAWAAAGLPGDPPAVKFPGQMAVFLAGPAGCGIVAVQNRKKLIVVLYKDAGFDNAASRVRALPFSPKPVVIKPAE